MLVNLVVTILSSFSVASFFDLISKVVVFSQFKLSSFDSFMFSLVLSCSLSVSSPSESSSMDAKNIHLNAFQPMFKRIISTHLMGMS